MSDYDSVDREKQRAALIERISSLITRAEGGYGTRVYFYDVLLLLFGREVSHCRIEVSAEAFEGVPPYIAEQIIKFFDDDVRRPVRTFQKNAAEGDDLFIQLLTNAEAPLAVAHRTAARRQERELLQQAAQIKPSTEQQQ